MNVQQRQEELKAATQPFNLTKKASRPARPGKSRASKPKKKQFKATPAPYDILDSRISERLQEEQEIRKLRAQQRARSLLREAEAPITEKGGVWRVSGPYDVRIKIRPSAPWRCASRAYETEVPATNQH